jgi:hypothetical protein
MWTLDQGQTQQEDWTLITQWGKSTQGWYADRQEPPPKKKNKIAFDVLNAETLKRQRPIGEGDQELDKRLVWEELI